MNLMDRSWQAILFWSCVVGIAYPYLIYPMALAAVARLRGWPIRAEGGVGPSVSILVVAHNEAAAIGRRIRELARLIDASDLCGEVIVVSDGSTDGTAEAA